MRFSLGCAVFVLSSLAIAFGQDTNFPTGPQYLLNSDVVKNGSTIYARPISTPSMSLAGPPLEVGASNATDVLIAGADNQTMLLPSRVDLPKIDLFPIFYGTPETSAIEISFPSETSANQLSANILDTGVWQITTARALRERDYGVTLGEAAVYSKAHIHQANRVYTNADIDRLRSGS